MNVDIFNVAYVHIAQKKQWKYQFFKYLKLDQTKFSIMFCGK